MECSRFGGGVAFSLDFQDRLGRRDFLLEPGHFGLELMNPLLEGDAPGGLATPLLAREPEDGLVWCALRPAVRWEL